MSNDDDGKTSPFAKVAMYAVADSVLARAISRITSVVGLPLAGFFAWQLWVTATQALEDQRDMRYDIRDLKGTTDDLKARVARIENFRWTTPGDKRDAPR